VTTHTDNVSVPGWSGAGYIVIDPKTGDGAYLISGGTNGGFTTMDEFLFLLGSYIGDKTNLAHNKIFHYFSKLISTVTKTLVFGSLFMGITNSYITCQNSGFLTMVVIHAVAMILGLFLLSTFANPIIGIMVATMFSFLSDTIVKPLIQNEVCK